MMSTLRADEARGKAEAAAQRARHLEKMLWLAGILGAIYCLVCIAQMERAHNIAETIRHEPIARTDTAVLVDATSETLENPGKVPAVVGRVEIPALGLTTPLLAGDDAISLTQGAGHIPGTALPGGLGTVGIAGHRDTHFRLLNKVMPGMEVRLISREGIYHYRVTSTEIVPPEKVSVLATGSVPSLVLVTCYPFGFIGHAPERFIVHAALVSAAPDA